MLRIVERREPSSGQWDMASYPLDGSCFFLYIDGLLSQSNDDHLSLNHLALLQNIERDVRTPMIRAFSYSRPGTIYSWKHTLRGINRHVYKLTDTLENIARGTTIVPVAFSMGGAVLLLSLERCLELHGETWLSEKVPLAILIQPAIHGCPEFFELSPRAASLFDTQPQILFDLGPKDGKYPSNARKAIDKLLYAGLSLNIAYAEEDGIAPYVPSQDERLWECPITSDELTRYDKYMGHSMLPRQRDTVRFIYYLAKHTVTWLGTTSIQRPRAAASPG